MEYYLISIQEVDGANPMAITGYSTKAEAYSAYHSTLASNYVANIDSFVTMIINDFGDVIIKESGGKINETPTSLF